MPSFLKIQGLESSGHLPSSHVERKWLPEWEALGDTGRGADMDSVFAGDVLEPPRLVGQFHPNPTPPTPQHPYPTTPPVTSIPVSYHRKKRWAPTSKVTEEDLQSHLTSLSPGTQGG